jgi:hypothetical protein
MVGVAGVTAIDESVTPGGVVLVTVSVVLAVRP